LSYSQQKPWVMETVIDHDSPLFQVFLEGMFPCRRAHPLRGVATHLDGTYAKFLGQGKAVDSVMGTPEPQSSPTETDFGHDGYPFAPSAIQTPLPPQKLGQPVKLDMVHQGHLSKLWTTCLVRRVEPLTHIEYLS